MRKDPIGDELHKLREEFEKLVNGTQTKNDDTETTPERIAELFGLSTVQAKAWLEQEPNYFPADEKKQHFRTDEDETEPFFWRHKHKGG
jgi:hypothetical protein